MADRALLGVADRLGVAPQRARLIVVAARFPLLLALRQFRVAEVYVQCTLFRIDADPVAVLQQADRPAHRGFRPDMADAKAPGRAGEASIGDQRHLVAHTLAVN